MFFVGNKCPFPFVCCPPCFEKTSPRPPGDHTVKLLKSLGADVVVTPALLGNPDAYAHAVNGLAPPRLGLNCTGGSIAASVCVCVCVLSCRVLS